MSRTKMTLEQRKSVLYGHNMAERQRRLTHYTADRPVPLKRGTGVLSLRLSASQKRFIMGGATAEERGARLRACAPVLPGERLKIVEEVKA